MIEGWLGGVIRDGHFGEEKMVKSLQTVPTVPESTYQRSFLVSSLTLVPLEVP